MTLHVLALFLHTFCMMFFQIGRCYYFKSFGRPNEDTWANIWNWGRLAMYLSGVLSEVIVIYLFLEFSKPVSLKKVQGEDSDYEEELDSVRNPTVDLMYFVKTAPKLKRIRELDYNIDQNKGAAQHLFDDKSAMTPSVWNPTTEQSELGFRKESDEVFFKTISEFDDLEIDKLTEKTNKKWGGEEESQLRMAVFVAFVNNKDVHHLKKRSQYNRNQIVKRANLFNSVGERDTAILGSVGRAALALSEHKKSMQSMEVKDNSIEIQPGELEKTGRFPLNYSGKIGGTFKEVPSESTFVMQPSDGKELLLQSADPDKPDQKRGSSLEF